AKIQAGKQFPMLSVGNLEASREMLDVRDVARAYADLLACVKPPRVVNIACGKPHTMQELLKNLLATVHVPISVTRDPARSAPSDLPCSTGDPSLLRQATGWTPEVPLETTLRDTLNWWKERVRAGSVR
ncbi:MAG: GDP-mannose 4,6 dehydratase, partial [Armatimonadetes bacterium]|nr:GDP-mannose 4,6 dehydratase [Armatimonadota bacterium]